MNIIKSTIAIVIFVFVNNFLLKSQTPVNQNVITTFYYYDFSGELSTSSLEQMETEVKQLTNVDEVKVKYKIENKLGQLIVVVKEKQRISESDILFQPTDLKHIISKYGLMPKELKTEIIKN